jgi:ribosomal protein S12 methylthiotransferase
LAQKNTTSTIAFVTLGCAKNEADSNNLRALVRNAGLLETSEPAEADFILINTCAFITAATEESLDAILEAAELESVKSGRSKLVVCGCLPARYGDELAAELPEVAAFVDVSHEGEIMEVLSGLGARGAVGSDVQLSAQTVLWESLSKGDEPASVGFVDSLVSNTTDTDFAINRQPWAYVKISDGCSRKCSFCTIPMIRGPYHSYSFEQINLQIADLVNQGVKEIILIGQDTGIWGNDLDSAQPKTLAKLLDTLANKYPETWLRVMYLQPQGINEDLLNVMAEHNNICSYLDIPLQHANAKVIREMHRSGNGKKYLDLITKIRAAVPGVTLRTTLIAGFPGETRADARELEQFIETAKFDYVGVFCYSQEQNTQAGERTDQVPMRTRKARLQRLRDVADRVGFEQADTLYDSLQKVLVCGQDEQGIYGRTQGQAPEVDGVVYLTGKAVEQLRFGDIVSVKITDTICYDLYAELA